jgi:hypothetical protein
MAFIRLVLQFCENAPCFEVVICELPQRCQFSSVLMRMATKPQSSAWSLRLSENALASMQPFPMVSSTYFEGRTCELTKFGNNRDGKTPLAAPIATIFWSRVMMITLLFQVSVGFRHAGARPFAGIPKADWSG